MLRQRFRHLVGPPLQTVQASTEGQQVGTKQEQSTGSDCGLDLVKHLRKPFNAATILSELLSSTLVSVVFSTAKASCSSVCWSRSRSSPNPAWSIASRTPMPDCRLEAASDRPTPGRRSKWQLSAVTTWRRFFWLRNAKSSTFISFTRALPSASALAFRSWCASWYLDLMRQVLSVTSGCCHCHSSGSSGCCFPFLVPFLPLPLLKAGASGQDHELPLLQLMAQRTRWAGKLHTGTRNTNVLRTQLIATVAGGFKHPAQTNARANGNNNVQLLHVTHVLRN